VRWAGRYWLLLLAAAGLVALVVAVNPPRLVAVLSRMRWQLALLMVPVTLVVYICQGTAWWVALRRTGVRISLFRCLTLEFAGQVFVYLPLGDLARVALMHRARPRERVGALTGTVVFQELTYMMLVGFGVLPRVASRLDVTLLVLLMTALHVGVVTTIVWKPAYDRGRRLAERFKPLQRFDRALRELRPAFLELLGWRSALPIIALQSAAALLSFVLFHMALLALGLTHISFVTSTFILGLSYILAGMSFVPGGLGAFEGLLTILMVGNGVPAAAGAAAGLVYRSFTDLLTALIGAPFALVASRRNRGDARKAQGPRARADELRRDRAGARARS